MSVFTMGKTKEDAQCIYNELDSIIFYLEGLFEFAKDKEQTKAMYDAIHGLVFTQRYVREAELDKQQAYDEAGLTEFKAERDKELNVD